jgi:hypothetical protein
MPPDSNNPFLIPPPPPGMPAAPEQPTEVPAALIVPPVRIPTVVAVPPIPTVTAIPILTEPTVRHAVSTARVDAPDAADKIVFFAATPGAPRSVGAGWRLILADGSAIPVDRAMFLGRNPARTPDRPGAALVPIDDPARSLSKTHALLELDAGTLWVHDLDSTNGVVVAVAVPGQAPMLVEPGERAAVAAETELRLGTYVLKVERTA